MVLFLKVKEKVRNQVKNRSDTIFFYQNDSETGAPALANFFPADKLRMGVLQCVLYRIFCQGLSLEMRSGFKTLIMSQLGDKMRV